VYHAHMAEGHTEGSHRAEQVTVSQAAKILQVHRNTVHNYIQKGRLRASKTVDGGREFYLIERDSLSNVQKGKHEHTLDAQPPAEHTEIAVMLAQRLEDLVQRYGQELGSIREELGAERVRREQAERERDELLEALRGGSERPLRNRAGEESGEVPSPDTEEPRASNWWPIMRMFERGEVPPTDTEEPRRSWWRRFFGFE
jgi:excisionase family DNA binding protein